MYVHLISNAWAITPDVIRFYERNLSNEDHKFLLINSWNKPQGIEIPSDIKAIGIEDMSNLNLRSFKDCNILLSKLKMSDLIILHDLSSCSLRMMILIFLLYQKYFNKIVWMTWGHDLYTALREIKFSKNLRGLFYTFILRFFAKRVNAIITCSPTDVEISKTKFNRSNVFYLPYRALPLRKRDYRKDTEATRVVSSDKIRVLCSHRVAPATKTYDIIEPLSRFKNNDLNLILPCNMSNEYYQKVKSKMLEIFNEKVIVLDEFLPINEYYKLLESIDIAIFPTHWSQQALGTIRYLFKYNKKVFLSEKSLMYDFFIKLGCEIYKFEDIYTMSFAEFVAPIKGCEMNKRYVKLIENDTLVADLITQVFQKLKNKENIENLDFFKYL